MRNPCEHTGLPKVIARKSPTLTPDEFDQLLRAVPDRYRLMVETFIETGMHMSDQSPGVFVELDVLDDRALDAQQGAP